MTTYSVLARYGTAAACKLTALAFLVLALHMLVLTLVLAVLVVDRAVNGLLAPAAAVTVDSLATPVHPRGGRS